MREKLYQTFYKPHLSKNYKYSFHWSAMLLISKTILSFHTVKASPADPVDSFIDE